MPLATVATAWAGYQASLWGGEHVVLPDPRVPPSPLEPEDRIMDPVVTLAFVAAHTTRIRLGTGIGLPAQHDPISLAKQIASLDRLSGGRFVYGIGYGWNLEEMEDHGVDPKRRRARVRLGAL